MSCISDEKPSSLVFSPVQRLNSVEMGVDILPITLDVDDEVRFVFDGEVTLLIVPT